MNILTAIKNSCPTNDVTESELDLAFSKFCSFMCIIHNKKMNLATILLTVLQDELLRNTMKSILDIDDERECIRVFFRKDSTLYKSKYIRKYVGDV
jgi:hypothetical protein